MVTRIAEAVVAEGRAATGTTFYNIPGINLGAVGTFTIVVDTLYHFPMVVTTPITINTFAIEITTAVAATNVRIGLYTADRDWQPETRVVDAGTIDSATTGVKTISSTQSLDVGRYLLVCVSNGGPAAREFQGTHPGMSTLDTSLGATPFGTRHRRAFTYAALPATPSDWDTVTAVAADPARSLVVVAVNAP